MKSKPADFGSNFEIFRGYFEKTYVSLVDSHPLFGRYWRVLGPFLRLKAMLQGTKKSANFF